MKKLKNLFALLFCMMSVVMLASCDNSANYKVEFSSKSMTLEIGEVVNLEQLVTLKLAKMEQVSFTSSDQSVVFVKPNNQMETLKNGVAIIQAKAGQSLDYLTITVASPLEPFSAVTNLSFDDKTGKVSWAHPYKVKNGTTILPNSYDVKIVFNGNEEIKTTTNNYYEFSVSGTYQVSVIAKAEGYAPSLESEKKSFTLLNAPQNLTYNKETSVLSWDAVEGAQYLVYFNDYNISVQANSVVLPFNIPGQHKMKVQAIKEGSSSKLSNELVITRLANPQISIRDGVLYFDVAEAANIDKYIIQIEDAYGQQSEVENTTGQYSLQGFSANVYYLKVFAIGNSANVLNSLNPETFEVEKLQSPSLLFNEESKTISVLYPNATVEIINKITQEREVFDLGASLSMTLNKTNGLYEIFAYYKSTQDNQIMSDNSNHINVKILSNITQLRHISENGISAISFKGVVGAEGYNILVNGVSEQFTLTETPNLFVFTMTKPTSELFPSDGTYVISIEAYDSTFESQVVDNHEFYLITNNSANETINITRLPQVSVSQENKVITWNAISLASSYSYKLYKNNEILLEGKTNQTTFSVENQSFGNYQFEIKALGNNQTILDCLASSVISFQIKETLGAPAFTFDRQTKELIVGQVENADTYTITFQSEPLATLTSEHKLFVGDLFIEAGLYEFSVIASSSTNSADGDSEGNLYSSSASFVSVEKLPILTNFTIQNQYIVFDLDEDVLEVLAPEMVSIMHDGQIISATNLIQNFASLDAFTISIQLLANITLQNPYYLDSDFSDFDFERIAIPTSLHYENGSLSWQASTVSKYNLKIQTTSNIYSQVITTNSKQLTEFSDEPYYEQMIDNGFSFAVSVQVDTIAADYQTINYISSKFSDFYAVEVLDTPEIVSVTFDDEILQNNITITWGEVANATGYVVSFQSVDYSLPYSQTSYTFAKQANVNTYEFKVKALSQTHLESKQSVMTFEKIANPDQISIDTNEKVTVTLVPSTVKNILFNGQTFENNIYSLSEITDLGQIEILFEAKGLIDSTYYLNSDASTYSFERLAKVQNVEVVNNEIVWEVEELSDKYEITIINSLSETKVITILAKTGLANYVSSFPLVDDEVLQFTGSSGIYGISIRAIKSPYTLNLTHSSGNLSSLPSDMVNFGKLENVSNLSVLAEETDEQEWVTITFDEVAYATSYDVFFNGTLFSTVYSNSLSTNQMTYSSTYTSNGLYDITVVANAENYISSSLSESYIVRRLPKVTSASLTITDNGRFSWVGVSNNSGYKVYYKRAGESASDVYFANNVYYDFSSLLTQDDFSGYIDFYVLVAGNGTTTLSSEFVTSSKVRIDKPEFEVYGSYLIISESELWKAAKYNVSVKFDNGSEVIEIRTLTLSANTRFNFPDVWTYQNNPITQNGTYIFEVYAFDTDTIFSPKAQILRQKLQAVSILGFIKLSGDDQPIVLKANASGLSSISNVTYLLKVDANNYTYSQVTPDGSSILTYPISGELDYNINSGNFAISIQASKEGYLDSSKATISGYRLSSVSRLDGSGGILNWAQNTYTGVSGYLLRVLHSEDEYERFSKPHTASNEPLQGISGNIVANIKVLGNLQVGVQQTSNIILDSTYMLEGISQEILQEKNFTTTKLNVPSSFNMLFGQFQIAMVSEATGYVVKDQFGRLFPLQTIPYEDDYAIGLSSEFYSGVNKLNLNTTYTMNVRAVSDVINVLYSDFSSTSRDIRVMPNPNMTQNDMTFAWSTSQINSITITWKESSISSRYFYELVAVTTEGTNVLRNTYYDMVTGNNSLTLNMDDYPFSGNYYFKISVLGKLLPEIGGFYYITSDLSPALEFVKLRDPKVEVDNGRLSWDTVAGANGYYIYYTVKNVEEMVLSSFTTLYTEYPYMQNQLYWNAPTSFGSLDQSLTYYFGVRAVNTVSAMKIAPSSVGAVYDYIEYESEDDEEIVEKEYLETLRPVTKLEAPNQLQLISGKLVWKESGLDYNYSIDFATFEPVLNSGSKPFVYNNDLDELQTLTIVIKLIDTNGVERKYNVPAVKFFHATIADSPLFEVISEMIGLPSDFEFGWPVLNWFANELGATVVPGLQSMSISQKGNSYNWLDSNYTSGKDVYIAHAPVTRISNYVLSWDPISLPVGTYAYGAANKYTVVAENELGERKYIHETNNLSVDLRDLVNTDQLLSGRHKIYVMVTGDSNTYLYGLPSTPIEVMVLPTVSASLTRGVLDWASISQAATYNVILDPNNINYKFESLMNAGPWDFQEIAIRNALNAVLTYNLSIQAIGNGTNVISGKVTQMGQIIKLDTPNMSVSEGILVWENIMDNDGYEMIIRRNGTLLSSTYLPKDRMFYESKTTGFNNYNLRAVGTTSGNLNELSESFAISSESENGVDAIMLNSITTVRAHEGKMLWSNIRELNNTPVAGYKITFDDVNYYDPVFVSSFSPITLEGQSYIIYEIDSSYLAGAYKIYVQPYSTNTYVRAEDGKTYRYLLGGILSEQSSVEFVKLRNVSNISSVNGVLVWDDNESLSDNFKVTFTRAAQQVVFYTSTNEFNPAELSYKDEQLYATLLVGEQYSVKVQTIGNNYDLINSDEIESLGYTKLSTISNVEYLIDESGEEGFIIRWLFANYMQEITDYNYIIRYTNSDNAEEEFVLDSRFYSSIRRGYLESRNAYYGEIDGSLLMSENTQELSFRIAIVPMTTVSVLTSDFSPVRSVTPPTSLSGLFTYVESSRKIAWEYDSNGTDVSFRIIDEIVSIGANNEITVLETRTYTSQEKEFYPELVGIHRISISVMLTGEQVASSYVYFKYDISQTGIINDSSFIVHNNGDDLVYSLINFDLFASGDGSAQTPYEIASQGNFENINQRLTKPSYMLGDSRFYFKQTANLSMTLSNTIGTFGGVYDGNQKQLTWQKSNTSATKVGLFTTLEPNAIIQNVVVSAKIIQLEDLIISTLYLSSLVAENYGTIQNSQIKSFVFETSMSRGIEYYYGSFASTNYGIIKQSVNTANITFDGSATQSSIRNSKVYVGGVAYINSSTTKLGVTYIGTITQTGNTGLIKVVSNSLSIGGIVASTNSDSSIAQSYNKGNIDATVTASATTTNYIGGLVAYNQGSIRNSYNVASLITINMSNFNRAVYIGGISGYIFGAKGAIISNSYTTTTNITVTNNTQQANVIIGLMVGYSNASRTSLQTTSYYTYTSSIAAINNAPTDFSIASISNFANLLTNLNLADYVFSQGTTYPILTWEKTFTIV